jgi:hypothetical protein
MVDQFPHTSRAGHFGLTFSPELMGYLGAVATALVPGDGEYPSGSEAQVSTFIQDRSSEGDREVLLRLSSRWPADDADQAIAAVREMEAADPEAFLYLRELVYHGYYSSRRVLAAMADRGYGYHGAPQPLGYRIEEQMNVPSKVRGTYVSTDEVSRASR